MLVRLLDLHIRVLQTEESIFRARKENNILRQPSKRVVFFDDVKNG